MFYFAYGSNMSRPRIEKRIGKVRFETTAILPGHRLAFSKVGFKDGSGKCCFERTGDRDSVHGVIFHIEDGQRKRLDRAEGLGFGYRCARIAVLADGQTETEVETYEATRLDSSLRPFSWYVQHVAYGAIDAGLPAEYIAAICRTPFDEDPETSRAEDELSIYEDLDAKLGPFQAW